MDCEMEIECEMDCEIEWKLDFKWKVSSNVCKMNKWKWILPLRTIFIIFLVYCKTHQKFTKILKMVWKIENRKNKNRKLNVGDTI